MLGRSERSRSPVKLGSSALTGDASASTRMMRLLDALAADAAATPTPALPIVPHAERLPSGERGVSLDALRGLCDWLKRKGDKHLAPTTTPLTA